MQETIMTISVGVDRAEASLICASSSENEGKYLEFCKKKAKKYYTIELDLRMTTSNLQLLTSVVGGLLFCINHLVSLFTRFVSRNDVN